MKLIIQKYNPAYASAFEELNLFWMKKNGFEVTEVDKAELHQPERNIIKKGGQIFFALADDLPIGTIGFIPNNSGVELAKLAVDPGYRGLGIATQLVEKALQEAKAIGYREVHLYTDKSKLSAAHALYLKMGFAIAQNDNDKPRCETKMIKEL